MLNRTLMSSDLQVCHRSSNSAYAKTKQQKQRLSNHVLALTGVNANQRGSHYMAECRESAWMHTPTVFIQEESTDTYSLLLLLYSNKAQFFFTKQTQTFKMAIFQGHVNLFSLKQAWNMSWNHSSAAYFWFRKFIEINIIIQVRIFC